MKKLLLSVAIVGIAFFASCEEKEPEGVLTSLAGTHWKGLTDFGDGFWIVDEMTFTSSTATFTSTRSNEENPWSFSAPYTYDPLTKVFVLTNEAVQPYPVDPEWYIPDLEGKIENDIMMFDIWESFDVIRPVELSPLESIE